MNSDEIRAKKWTNTRDVLIELTAQFSQLNERLLISRLTGETKQTKKRSAPREGASMARTGNGKLFHVSCWMIDAKEENIPNFIPNDDQPEIKDLELGDKAIGRLGRNNDVVITRKR